MDIKTKKTYRAIEFILLFFGIPLLMYFGSFMVHPVLILLPVLGALLIYFRNKKDFSFKSLVRLNVSKNTIRINIGLIFLVGLLLTAFVVIVEPESLFNLPRKNAKIWLLLCISYPPLSAWPQEIIYRTFLFTRYTSLFRKRRYLILASGITFSFAHIVYYSPVSMALTLFAGLYLAYVYEKTKSVLFTTILHSAYGILVFTLGLGHYFWLNMEQYL
ncbi:MAG: CPBP family intramembrane glutamic endopeptidase [Prolixibacteraceae bacterium]